MNRFKLLNTTRFSSLPLMVFTLLLFNVLLISACGGSSASKTNIGPPSLAESTSLIQFSFLVEHNPQLESDINLVINNNIASGRTTTNIDVENLVATFDHEGSEITVNDIVQNNNSTMNDFTNIVTYIVKTADGSQKSYQIDLTKFTGLPIVYLSTNSNAAITSKDDYVEGSVVIEGNNDTGSLKQATMKIRGRGNSTWGHPKKPFQMKLSDKSEILGMPEDKKWLFLAEYSDKTMLRNKIAFEMGYISALDWTPQSQFAEVYINNEYNGTYNITQKVEESDNRVALGNSGYLLEIDQLDRLDADDVYFYTDNFLINVKEPNLDLASAEYHYVKDLINEFEIVLHSNEFNDSISGYEKFIDIESFIDWYLISEITKNVDSKLYSSIYLNLIPGEKIKMGPLWDFDLSFGNVDYADSQYAQGFWVKDNPWYTRLFQDPAFVTKVNERFAYFKSNQQYILEKIDQQAERLKWAQQENDEKWQTIGNYVWPNPIVLPSYDEEIEHLKTWYVRRMNWLDTALKDLK